MSYKELKIACEKILELHSKISSCALQDEIDEIESLMKQREVLKQKIIKMANSIVVTTEQKASLAKFSDEIRKSEQELLSTLETKKEQIRKKLLNMTKNSSKLVSAYTIGKKFIESKLFDIRE